MAEETKTWTELDKKKDCTKKSLVYETWCQTCYEEEHGRIEQEVEDEEEKEEELNEYGRKLQKIEKAKARKKMWKEWRNDEASEVKMEDKTQDDEEETEPKEEGILLGEEVGEQPGQGNSPHNAGKTPEPGWVGGMRNSL